MNSLDFILLMKDIYGPGMPDLAKIQKKGLLAVKIAQHFALRVDFLDADKCRHLAKLYRQASAIPGEELKALLKTYVPAGWMDNFKSIEDKPLGTASVGQVHRATLKDGSDVVVKVIKGNFKKKFTADVQAVKKLFKTAIFFYPKLSKVFDPVGAINNIEDYTLNELNLLNEIHGQETLKKIQSESAKKTDLSRLKFPRMYGELSGENVLVSEFLDGTTFDELLEKGKLDYDDMLELFHIHGYYLFGKGVFHGDIHPGNIMLKGRDIYFIDTSAVSTVREKTRLGLLKLFEAMSSYDYEACAHALNGMADVPIGGPAFTKFKERFYELYKDFKGSKVKDVSLTKKMMDTIKLGVLNGMVFDKDMFPVIKSLMYLDGMVLKCRPETVLIEDMRGFVKEAMTW